MSWRALAQAEETIIVVPPHPDRTVALERQAMHAADRDRDHIRQVSHWSRRELVALVADAGAQHALVIAAPGPYGSILLERQAHVAIGRDGHHTCHAGDAAR